MIYLKQLKSLFKHKWYVFLAGRMVGVPLWRLFIHDWSKFTPTEFVNYSRFKYGVKRKEEWAKAWHHHLHHNPHHPEYWLLSWRGNPDFYKDLIEPIAPFIGPIPMTEKYVKEMVADMLATSKEVTGRWDISGWVGENVPAMKLHDLTIIRFDFVMMGIGFEITGDINNPWRAGNKFTEWAGEFDDR